MLLAELAKLTKKGEGKEADVTVKWLEVKHPMLSILFNNSYWHEFIILAVKREVFLTKFALLNKYIA